MEGITYFRLKSQYKGDVTKNCALTGNEIDNNFNVLEGRDIQSLEIKDDEIVLTLKNGDVLKARDAFKEECVTDITFDKINGVLKINRNGEIEEIDGFATSYNSGNSAYISIAMNKCEHIFLPYFNLNSGMYKRMEIDKEYTLKDLGLWMKENI